MARAWGVRGARTVGSRHGGAAGAATEPLEEDANALRGACLSTMPLPLGALLPSLRAEEHAPPLAMTDDDVLDEAYDTVCAQYPAILDASKQQPVANVTRDLEAWLRARGRDDLLKRVSKDHVKGRLRTRRRKQVQMRSGAL